MSRQTVATIGNFDGVHFGHQRLIETMLKQARFLSCHSLLILFEPLPKEFFTTTAQPYRIQTLTDKLLSLQQWAIDKIHIVHFNAAIARQSPEQFITHTLRAFGVIELVVGHDFQFGQNRQGSIADLSAAGIQPVIVEDIIIGGRRVSSSLIREALWRGDFESAEALTGRPYYITGRVNYGAQNGRLLGFPTVNIALRKKMPVSGVYAVKVHGLAENALPGVANVGRHPSLNPLAHPLLEVHIIDYNQEIYQHRLRVEFIRKIREEQKFTSITALKSQIEQDVVQVKQNLKKEG